jgi:hypothetical protein
MPPRPTARITSESNEVPECLKPYQWHGVDLAKLDTDEPRGECPFCGKAGKFYTKSATGQWFCQICGEGGNSFDFLRKIHTLSMAQTRDKDYTWISEHRGLEVKCLRAWGICRSVTTGDWVVPAYGAGGGITNLYRFMKLGEKYRLAATPGLQHGFFAPLGWDKSISSTDILWVCEGVWDAAAWKQEVGDAGVVIATPGCNVWNDSWNRLITGKVVTFLFDNDYPKKNENTGQITQAGFDGLKSAVGKCAAVVSEDAAKEIRYLHWGDRGYSTDFDDGADVRDVLKQEDGAVWIEAQIKPVPAEWIEGKQVKRGANQGLHIHPLPCDKWRKLRTAWKSGALLTPELEGALAVMLASIASVKGQGEQIWIKLISPAASGKSMLCSALGVARRYTVEDDGMNGFFSGYNDAKKGEEVKDYSLAGRLYDKTLITKEGATLIDSPMRDVVISQSRTLYDGSASKTYNNGLRWEHHGLRFTWILAGTQGLRVLDSTELGQRFIDYTIIKDIDPELNSAIMKRALRTQAAASRVQSNCKQSSTMDSDRLLAYQLTGGYIDHLRKGLDTGNITVPDVSDEIIERIERLADFVEYMRARPSSSQEEIVGRALATRVGGQLLKLAQYLAVVYQKKEVDSACMKIVEKVALDTSEGRTLEIVKALEGAGTLGLELRAVAVLTRETSYKEAKYLDFLVKLKAVERFEDGPASLQRVARYRLDPAFRKLYREVMKRSK